jgi:signal transduction histidine kinase
MNLTRRFSLTHGFIALLAVTITLGVMIGGARLLFWNEMSKSQARQITDFSLQARESYFGHEDVGDCNFIRQAVKDETVAFVAFVDVQNKPRLVLPQTFHNFNFTSGTKYLTDGRTLSVLSQGVTAGGTQVGTVAIGYDSDKLGQKVRAQMARWLGLGAAGGVCALLVALVTSYFLARQLVRPLKRIRAGTQEVRLGKLDKLVDVHRSDEIGDLARDFNDMVVKLKELEAMKRDFVAGVTHDFGTPLHAIKNALEFLQDGMAGPLTDRQAEYLLMISNSNFQLTSFVNNLLTTAQIEAAKSEPFYEALDAKALATEVANLYRAQAQKQGLELLVLNESPSTNIVSDVVMLRQILTNLVSNAMKYTLKGSITILLAQEKDFFVLKVKDTGVGIDPKNKDLIFDKFFRVRQAKDFPARQGSGLGLSIVKGLAESMGGSVSLESRPGAGTTFTVRLPMRPEGLTDARGM